MTYLQHRELYTIVCGSRNGKEIWGRMDTCIMYGWVLLLSTWNYQKIIKWLYSNRTNTQKRCPFHYRGLECKSRKSRNTWSNRQIRPWNVEWSRAKTNRVLPRKCTGHGKHPLPKTQEKTLHIDITRLSTPKSDWLYSLQPKMGKLYTVNKNKTGS